MGPAHTHTVMHQETGVSSHGGHESPSSSPTTATKEHCPATSPVPFFSLSTTNTLDYPTPFDNPLPFWPALSVTSLQQSCRKRHPHNLSQKRRPARGLHISSLSTALQLSASQHFRHEQQNRDQSHPRLPPFTLNLLLNPISLTPCSHLLGEKF